MPPRVSTPPAGGATVSQSHSLQSTPYIRGSGSNYSHRSQHGQDDYKPYLREDLTHQYKTSFNEFLDYILCYGRSLDNAIPSQNHDIISDNRFKTLLSKYREPIYQETDRYFPFVELANHVIDQLNIDPDLDPNSRIRFCRNDPVTIRGSHAIKKPEVIVVLNKSLEVPERGNVDNLMRHGPLEKQAGFWWTELLAFFEFKRVEKSLGQQDVVTTDDCSSTFLRVPILLLLSTYGSSHGGSVGVELSCRNIDFPVYISHTTRRTHSPYNDPPLRFAHINPFGFGVKAER